MLRLLLRLADHADQAGVIWLPRREEIGAMLGMTVETASRLVSQLRREGVLQPVGLRGARLDMPSLQEALRVEDAA